MRRFLALLLVLPAAAPFALAHVPPAPVPSCVGASALHEYAVETTTPRLGWRHQTYMRGAPPAVRDGNLAACPAGAGPADYDGDFEFGIAGAVLFSGDVSACFGEPSVAHHGADVFALDVLGFGPQFSVWADDGRGTLRDDPCGDGYFEPCDVRPPPPGTYTFPTDMVLDVVSGVVVPLLNDPHSSCNLLDLHVRFASTPLGASGGTVPFPPGPNGAYWVVIETDGDTVRAPSAGHVWTG